MKCISCEIEINPQWAHAIDINVCPFCGKYIMEEHLKNLFTTLRETMDNLSEYPDQLNDWMLSKHNYIRTDSPDLSRFMPLEVLKELKKIEDEKDFLKRKEAQKFTVKVQTEVGEEEVWAEKIQSEEATNDFFKRAEVIRTGPSSQQLGPNTYQSPAEKTQHLKKMLQQIKKTGSPSLTDSGEAGEMIPADMLEQADPEAVAEFQSMISGGEISSSLSDGIDDDEVPSHILAANTAIANRKSGGSTNAADLMKLQQMQERLRRSKDAFESGENRGGKGGGFSRA
jgi:Zn-finger nucleic acid-binding protein